MRQGVLAAFFALAGFFVVVVAQPVVAGEKTHYLAIHVDENDKGTMNIALNNAANVMKYYAAKGEKVEIEIVAYGPGLHMYRADTSPVRDRIAAMSLEYESLQFSACGNTLNGMAKKEGKMPELIGEATVVPSGVVRLMELQEEGWSYVRP